MQRSYATPARKSDGGFLKIIALICLAVFMVTFVYGAYQVITEIKSISASQQILITALTSKQEKKPVQDGVEGVGGETVSKIEFVKFKNETNRTIRELTLEIRLIQNKLKMKRTPLKK